MILEEYLVEMLLSVVLMFNVGAYTFLYREQKKMSESFGEDIERLDDNYHDLRNSLMSIWRRIFGTDEDDTMKGHLVETEDRFDAIDNKLEEISNAIECIDEDRKREHKQVNEQMNKIITIMTEEESFDVDESDIRIG